MFLSVDTLYVDKYTFCPRVFTFFGILKSNTRGISGDSGIFFRKKRYQAFDGSHLSNLGVIGYNPQINGKPTYWLDNRQILQNSLIQTRFLKNQHKRTL